ncbi:MAG: polyphenol oxidase family protein [Gemmatimonadota bacterium]|nr:polyphenol oxidase family protein [Gemmatimonadota bacterium]
MKFAGSLVEERAVEVDGIPLLRAAELEASFPGLVAGITTRAGREIEPESRRGRLDYGMSGGGNTGELSERYLQLASGLGFSAVALGRQVHGAGLLEIDTAPPAGMWIAGTGDGLIGPPAGCLAAVTVADCVPVYLVESEMGFLGLLHAGWRGAAAGILCRGIEQVVSRSGGRLAAVRIHLGPAICGDCYEVGPEVPQAFGLSPRGRTRLDLREILRRQAADSGLSEDSVTSSSLCTRCDAERFHSHRAAGEAAGRMAAFLGRLA